MTNVPEIRFKGFTDAWEQRRLGEVANISSGGTPSREREDFWDGHIPWVTTAEVHYQPITVTSEKITQLGLDNSSAKLVPIGTILMAMIGQGKTRGQVAVLEIEAATNQNNANIVVDENTSSHFVYFQLEGSYEKLRNLSSSAGQGSLNLDLIRQYKVSYVSDVQEQTTIGQFFRTLDNTIAIHKRKLDGLRKLKKAYLQVMFPKVGENVPRVRFLGFTEPWAQVALEYIAERVTRKNTKLESTLPLTISAQHGLIDQTEFFNKQVASRDVSDYFLIKKGEFAYNKSYSNGYPWGAVKRLDEYEKGVLSTLYIVFKPIYVDSEFLVQYYEADNWHTEIIKYAAEGARNHGLLNITPTNFFKTVLAIPSTREEQKVTGSFFETLDKQITALHKKVEQLGRLKSAYLQKMFV